MILSIKKISVKKLVASCLAAGIALMGFAGVASANGDLSPCTPHTATVVSDTTNTVVGGGNAVALSFIHPAWTASIPGATWIWSTNPVASPTTVDDTQIFEKNFTIIGTPLSAILDIATDNFYKVWVNGVLVAEEQTNENNFQLATQDNYSVANLVAGNNIIKIEATNKALAGSNPESNPAGVLYKLVVNSEECCPTPNCCAGDITVTNTNNNTAVVNTVTTISRTGGNSASGGSAAGNNSTGGNGGTIITGSAGAVTSVINKVNRNITHIRR